MTFVNKVTASKVVEYPTLTLLALHAAHPLRDFLCALCGTGFEWKYIAESRFGFGLRSYTIVAHCLYRRQYRHSVGRCS
jgi:hypothetical protein